MPGPESLAPPNTVANSRTGSLMASPSSSTSNELSAAPVPAPAPAVEGKGETATATTTTATTTTIQSSSSSLSLAGTSHLASSSSPASSSSSSSPAAAPPGTSESSQQQQQQQQQRGTTRNNNNNNRGVRPPKDKWSMPSTARIKDNWRIYDMYVRQEYDECLALIEQTLRGCRGQAEYPIYCKALIKRQRGDIQESLQLFQAATALNPTNLQNLKQVGRSLYLLGKHRQAIEVYDESLRFDNKDWEIYHNKGVCLSYMKRYEDAIAAFQKAKTIQPHESTFIQLAKVYTLQHHYGKAIEVYTEALQHSPESPEILTTIGLLHLRRGDNYRAFDYLGQSLVHDPRNHKSILAAGSIIQDHNDMDVALVKYRVAAIATPNSAQLWNNVGMCFFGKRNYVAAVACLKRALYLDPFEWIVAYNLGLTHLNTGQYASAFHYLSSSINLKPDFASSYMYLAIVLVRLSDFDNACAAYEKAIAMEDDHLFELNYTITLWRHGDKTKARQHYSTFLKLYNDLDQDTRDAEGDVVKQVSVLRRLMGGGGGGDGGKGKGK